MHTAAANQSAFNTPPKRQTARVHEAPSLEDDVSLESIDDEEFDSSFGITASIRQVIGAGIILGLGIVILNKVFSMEMVAQSSGPFDISTVTSPLGAALGILGLAIFVGGARIIMNQMGGGAGGGRGGL